MKKIFIIIFIAFFLFSCASPKKPVLTLKDKHNLDRWMELADLLYRIGDYRLSYEYYQRVVERYPGTDTSKVAKRKVRILQKVLRKSGEKDF
ncbi:MAG: hypothetical protein ABH954_00565 [Candidatus Omnitrophota bacterium]